MDRHSSAQLPVGSADDRRVINRLLVFFALVYVVEGIGQVDGLIAQPLSFYLKEVHGWTSARSQHLSHHFQFSLDHKAALWRLFRFRAAVRLSPRAVPFLAANIVAAGAFFWVTQLTAPGELLWALDLTAYAMAMSSTVCGAVLVENGQRFGESSNSSISSGCGSNAATMFHLDRRRPALLNACRRPRRCMSPLPS